MNKLISDIVKKINHFRLRHQFFIKLGIAFFWNLVGILLPTIACGVLLQVSGLQPFCEYLLSDLSKAAFSFSSASLLCVELIHGNGSKIHSSIKWGIGILLLMLTLLFSSGLAVNQIILESPVPKKDLLKVEMRMSPHINSFVAIAVSAYLAAMSCSDSDAANRSTEEFKKYVKNDGNVDEYVIRSSDLEMLIMDAQNLGRSENVEKE